MCTAHGDIFSHLLSVDENIGVVMASTRLDELVGWSVLGSSIDRSGKGGSFRSEAAEESDSEALRRPSPRTRELFSRHAANVPVASWPRYLQSSSGADAARPALRDRHHHQLFRANSRPEIRHEPRNKH